MDRDAYTREEGAVVECQKGKNGGSFSAEIHVASLERNSHQAQVQIFSPTCENKSFSEHFSIWPSRVAFHCML